jgi:hypothetical protein
MAMSISHCALTPSHYAHWHWHRRQADDTGSHSGSASDRRSESAPKNFRRELKSQPRQQLDCRDTAAAVCRVGRRTQELRFIAAGCDHWRPVSAGGSRTGRSDKLATTAGEQQLRCLVRRLIHRSAGQPWLAVTPWTGLESAAVKYRHFPPP